MYGREQNLAVGVHMGLHHCCAPVEEHLDCTGLVFVCRTFSLILPIAEMAAVCWQDNILEVLTADYGQVQKLVEEAVRQLSQVIAVLCQYPPLYY